MAATNRAKGAAKTPGWAVRGKLRLAHVPGGPAEAARLIYSGLWDKTPAGLLCAGRYSADLVAELTEKKINAVVLTWSPGFSLEGDVPQWELVSLLLPLLKKKKIRAIADLSLTGCFAAEFLPRVAEAKSWLERQTDGKPVSHRNENCLQMNAHHDGWRQYLSHKVRMAAGAGFDGFYFSDVHATEAEAASFLTWLREIATTARPPESGEMLFFCAASLPALAASTNLKRVEALDKPVLDSEHPGANLIALKALFELGGRDLGFVCGLAEGLTEKEARVATAEILAMGGSCHGLRMPAAYQNFFAEHADLLSGADPVNSVALLVDDDAASLASLRSDSALAQLLRHGIQFDVIPAGQLGSFDLKKYRVLIGTHLRAATPATSEALSTFASQFGGTSLQATSADAPRSEEEKGKGRILHHGMPLTAESAKAWLEDIRRFAGEPPIEVESVGNLIALLWGKGTKRWVHVINYTSKPVDATVALPGCGGRTLAAHSPDEPTPQLTIIETGTANAKFTLKGVQTYAIVEVN